MIFCVSVEKDTMDSHFSKLRDSLIEICVLVGMDQDTGLVQTLSPEVSFFCRIIRWEAFGQVCLVVLVCLFAIRGTRDRRK